MRGQGAQGLNVKGGAEISRRQFLTGAFREHYRFGWKEESRIGRDCTAPEAPPKIQGWEDGIDHVLEEMEDLKGIEDF